MNRGGIICEVRRAVIEHGGPFVSAAVHEAGHAVVALALGEAVRFIEADVIHGVACGVCRHTAKYPDTRGIVAYAGALAQRLFLFPVAIPSINPAAPHTRDGAWLDEKSVFDSASRFAWSEASERRVCRNWFERAKALTLAHCQAIGGVALALLDTGYLDGRAVERIIDATR